MGKATPTIGWSTPADITFGTALGATQLNATATFGGPTVPGTFVYTPAAATVLPAGAGQTLSVTFTPTDPANYTTATTNVAINVVKATPVVTWNAPASITYGTALGATQLNATASVPGTFVYTPPAGTVLAGRRGAGAVGDVHADRRRELHDRHGGVAITVLKATPVITWSAPANIVYGTALGATQLNATASVPGTFVYTPAAGTVLSAGAAQTLSVTFTPTDAANYTNATKNVAITVIKATPVITWATPANIVYGTLLGATQLNATTPVAGSFVYTPAAGTLLTAGAAQALSVTFTPDRHGELQRRDRRRDDHRRQGDAGHHLGAACRHRLRHRAQRDAAERDRQRGRARSSTRRRPARSCPRARRRRCRSPSRRPMPRTTPARRRASRSPSSRRRRSSPGRRRRTSPTAPRSARRS